MGKIEFMQPVTNERKDWFGSHRHNGSTHYGIDYGSPEGTEVQASERGKVVRASFVPGERNTDLLLSSTTHHLPRIMRGISIPFMRIFPA